MKTSELTGTLLDYYVAKACNLKYEKFIDGPDGGIAIGSERDGWIFWRPSTNWADGGPIIERERITLESPAWGSPTPGEWCATVGSGIGSAVGPSPLIAAMRAYVASKFAEEVPEAAL